MYKIILTLVFLFSNVTLSKECLGISNTYKYYFINGVGNTFKSIDKSRDKLRENLDLTADVVSLLNPKNLKDGDEVFPGWLSDERIPTLGELGETFDQKELEATNKHTLVIDIDLIKEFYEALDNEKNNIVFAHSQGNLFANELCRYNNGRKKQINLSIATPANKTECGNKYVTLKDDKVINLLRAKIDIDDGVPQPLVANASLSSTEICYKDIFLCHGLIDIYLTQDQPLSMIRSFVKDTLKEISEKELNFTFVELTLRETKQSEKNVLVSSYESLFEVKDKADLAVRRTVASVRTLSYLSEVANSSLIGSLMKLNFSKVNKKEFKKMLDIEIMAESEKEYADVVAGFMESLKDIAKKYPSMMPSSVLSFFSKTKDFYYFKAPTYEDSSKFKEYTLQNPLMKWDSSVNVLSLNCKDVQSITENKSLPVMLSYSPEYSKIISLSVNDLAYDVYPKNLLNKSQEKETILNVDVSLKEGVYSYQVNALKNKVNYLEGEDHEKYKKCNSISKLLENKSCQSYLMTILSLPK